MRTIVYSRWDGSQAEFTLDPEDAVRAVSELMMHGMSLSEAMEWLRRHGLSAEGLSFRIMGMEELLQELRSEVERLGAEYHLDHALDEIEERLNGILDREQAAVIDRHGHESAALNAFMGRRHAGGGVPGSNRTISRSRIRGRGRR